MNRPTAIAASRICLILGFTFLAFSLLKLPVSLSQETNRAAAGAENAPQRVWIYKDVPGPGEQRKRDASELYFTPFNIAPAAKANDVAIRDQEPVKRSDGTVDGTCIEAIVRLSGATDWASFGFMPGSRLGERPPRDLVNDDHLVVGNGRPVFLRFRAKTAEGQRAHIRFFACGQGFRDIKDKIMPSVTTKRPVTTLTERWEEVEIDLTKEAARGGLTAVAFPLTAAIRAEDNPGAEQITVAIDDVRFEAGGPVEK
jgi:hypothetical protein